MSAMSPAAIEWHLHGEHGISSEAIFDRLSFGGTSPRWNSNHPLDPSDFRRCELLLRAVPEFRSRLSEMAAESPVWAALVSRWQEIAALLEEEVPGVYEGANGSAVRTYALMKAIEAAA